MVQGLCHDGVSSFSEQKPLQEPCPKMKKSIISAMLLKRGFSLFSKVKIPLVTVFWLASGPATVLADPPGDTDRSTMPCHALLTPVHFAEGTLTSVRTLRKTTSPLFTRFEYLLSTCLSARMGLLRCLRTHLELQLALPCPATPRVPPVHSSEGALRPFGHCAISDYPTIL